MSRTVWLVVFAMAMFTAGVIVMLTARTLIDYLLGGTAILGSLAVIVANINGKE